MSTYARMRMIEREIDLINHQIDMKIIVGRSYKKDAEQHKRLVRELRTLKASRENAWFSRMGRVASAIGSFML